MDSITDSASWAALIGAVLPLLIALFNQPRWTSQQRQLLGVGIAIAAGVATVITSGIYDPQNWLITIAAVIGASQGSYALLWKPTTIAPKIEIATSSRLEGGYADAKAVWTTAALLTAAVLVAAFTPPRW